MESKNQTICIEKSVFTALLMGYMENGDNESVRFDILIKCFNQAGVDKDLFDYLMKRAEQACDPQSLSIGCVYTASAYLVTNTPGAINTPMFSNEDFDPNDIARYACMTGSEDKIIHSPINHGFVSEKLGVSNTLLEYLDPSRVVIAGGAAMYLGCPTSLWDQSCDVDIFVLDVEHPGDVVMDIVLTLQDEGYIVCQYGSAVLTAVGLYGKRRIQIIKTSAKTAEDLIKKFDLNVVKAYYNGTSLNCTYSAAFDWSDMHCRNGSHKPLKPTRLARAFLKGFKLCDKAKKQLADTIGWPLSEKIKDKLLFNIPCLNPDVPAKVQHQLLLKMGLTPVGKGGEISIGIDGNGLAPMGNSYGPSGIFTGSMEEFINTIEKDDRYSKNRNMPKGVQIFPFKSRYLVALPLCSFPFSWNVDNKYEHSVISKLSIVNKEEEKKFCNWHDKICKKILPDFPVDTMAKEYSDVRIRISKTCSWWKNGIKHDGPFDIKSGDTVRVVGKATNITLLLNKTEIYVKFDIMAMYVHSTEPLEFSDAAYAWEKVEEIDEDDIDEDEDDIDDFLDVVDHDSPLKLMEE
jgi:hypothetical protein